MAIKTKISMRERRAHGIIKRLGVIGIKPVRYISETHYCDPLIQITEQIHIQVGGDYIAIVRIDDYGACSFFEAQNNITSIMKSLKEALNE